MFFKKRKEIEKRLDKLAEDLAELNYKYYNVIETQNILKLLLNDIKYLVRTDSGFIYNVNGDYRGGVANDQFEKEGYKFKGTVNCREIWVKEVNKPNDAK